jgi:hypothetical protein
VKQLSTAYHSTSKHSTAQHITYKHSLNNETTHKSARAAVVRRIFINRHTTVQRQVRRLLLATHQVAAWTLLLLPHPVLVVLMQPSLNSLLLAELQLVEGWGRKLDLPKSLL